MVMNTRKERKEERKIRATSYRIPNLPVEEVKKARQGMKDSLLLGNKHPVVMIMDRNSFPSKTTTTTNLANV